MRTRVAVAIGGLVAAWLSAVAAPAAASVLPAAPACTVVGTAGPDVLVGTAGREPPSGVLADLVHR